MPLVRFWPPVAWMAAIFLFSTSLFGDYQTGSVLETVVRFFYPDASTGFIERLNFMLRKSAHFTEYAILAILWHRALAAGRGRSFAHAASITLIICTAYAVTDEFHQSFVPNRSASAVDVMIDAAGAFAAVAAFRVCNIRRL